MTSIVIKRNTVDGHELRTFTLGQNMIEEYENGNIDELEPKRKKKTMENVLMNLSKRFCCCHISKKLLLII